jgi:hypothetical protein
MKEFEISWTQEIWYRTTIKANNENEARELFWSGEFDGQKETGAKVQDGIDIKEINNG